MKFTEFGLSEKVLKGLEAGGFEEATDIQGKAIPPLLQGRNIVGQAITGSGKTLAFGIPILERLNENIDRVQAVIITPTRELAKQVEEEIFKVAKFTKIKTATIYGGVSFQNQINLINRGAQIIVATPGRLIDHLKSGLRLNPKIIVLDEADKMFDMGFYKDVNYILKLIKSNENQQFMFFGATIPDEIISLAQKYAPNPVIIAIRKENEEKIPNSIEQFYYIIAESSNKLNALIKILDDLKNQYDGNNDQLKILIFVKTRIASRCLSEDLNQVGCSVKYINSDLPQLAREKIMEEFQRKGMILIATDVVSRGIDIENITHIINYDMPSEIENYVHRVGRTGRMGKIGTAITFVSLEEHPLIFQIEQKYNTKIRKRILEREGNY